MLIKLHAAVSGPVDVLTTSSDIYFLALTYTLALTVAMCEGTETNICFPHLRRTAQLAGLRHVRPAYIHQCCVEQKRCGSAGQDITWLSLRESGMVTSLGLRLNTSGLIYTIMFNELRQPRRAYQPRLLNSVDPSRVCVCADTMMLLCAKLKRMPRSS